MPGLLQGQGPLRSQHAVGGEPQVGADHVRPRLDHLGRLLFVKDIGHSEEVEEVRQADSFHLPVIGTPILFQGLSELSVDQAHGGEVVDSRKAAPLDLPEIFIEMQRGVPRVDAKEDRHVLDEGKQLPGGEIHDNIIAVGIAQKTGQRAAPHLAEPGPRSERAQNPLPP